ncbi:alpha-ribazole phosphatase [Azotosporobacter soli]|uniref:alpha-ribazole phosphatase n=1 Tax=Azotosporobacter soli TaxID=3055040 RepID=UPI0031FF4089
MTRVFLIRHGETEWNKNMKYQGQTDVPLSDAGRKQAEKLASRLSKVDFAAVYSSDLIRAYETATVLAAPHELPVTVCPGLKEINFGEWEGLTYDNISGQWSGEMQRLFSRPNEVEIPSGESFYQVQQRVVASLEELVKAHENETILVVSHGAAIRTAICAALEIPLNNLWSIRQDNTALNIFEYHAERIVIGCLNDSNHLAEKK